LKDYPLDALGMALYDEPDLLRPEIWKMLLQTACGDYGTLTKIGEDVGHVGGWVIDDDLERFASVRALIDEDDSVTEVGNEVGLNGWLGVVMRNPEEDHHRAKEHNHGKVGPEVRTTCLQRARRST